MTVVSSLAKGLYKAQTAPVEMGKKFQKSQFITWQGL